MKRLIVAAAALVLALAGVAWAKTSISASPSSVKAGRVVRLSGSVGAGCARGDQVTLISRAFTGKHRFAGVPAIYTTTSAGGAFATAATIPKTRKPGKYTITGRCGGGNLGVAATLTVLKP